MSQDTNHTQTAIPVASLRRRRLNGSPYSRPHEVEALLTTLVGLSPGELLDRARIQDPDNPLYLPSECLLHFVRHTPQNGEELYRELFLGLRQRVLAAVPVFSRRVSGTTQLAENVSDQEVRESVLHKFQVLLCKDRSGYEEQLDYFECRFNSALASLRATARRDVRRDSPGHESLDSDTDQQGPSPEIEQALARLRPQVPPDGVDFLYRSKLLRAISSLPADERRVVELILQGFQLEEIAGALACVEKTVRNRRDRAYLKLQNALREEETE